jgi:hypothetical protein
MNLKPGKEEFPVNWMKAKDESALGAMRRTDV